MAEHGNCGKNSESVENALHRGPTEYTFRVARPRVYPDDLADRLVAEASRRLATQPVDSLGLRELAASQGTTTNAIYTLFGGKDELIERVVNAETQDLIAQQQAAAGSMPTLASVIELSRAHRRWALAHPELYQTIFVHRSPRNGNGPANHRCAAAIEMFETVLGRVAESGDLAVPDVKQLALSLRAAMHGWMVLELHHPITDDPVAAEARFDEHIRVILEGAHISEA